jgi:uncharacterized protein (TIGR03086 family)
MSTTAESWRRVADGFTVRAEAVPPDGWSRPSPCAGWVARDVVAHLVGWVPGFLHAGAGVEVTDGPATEDDPAGAWRHLADAVQALLDDPATAARPFEHPQAGHHTVEGAIAAFILCDVLVHTWDLARATGQDETLDPELVRTHVAGLAAIDEAVLVASGHYGPRVAVSDGADDQTRLLALTGRRA